VISYTQVTLPKPCTRLFSPPFALHAPPISLFLKGRMFDSRLCQSYLLYAAFHAHTHLDQKIITINCTQSTDTPGSTVCTIQNGSVAAQPLRVLEAIPSIILLSFHCCNNICSTIILSKLPECWESERESVST
jgi:hypothetical protein